MHAYRMNKCGKTTYKTVLDYVDEHSVANVGGDLTIDHFLGVDNVYCEFVSPSGARIRSSNYPEPMSFGFFYDLIKAYDGYVSYLASGEINAVYKLIESGSSFETTDANGVHTHSNLSFSFSAEHYHYHSEERHDCCD